MAPLKDRTILIFGGSSGIGYGVAEKCLTEGAKVYIISSSESKVDASVNSLKQKIEQAAVAGEVCDLSASDVEAKLEHILKCKVPFDHIVYTAGDSLSISPLGEIDLEKIHKAGHIRFAVPLLLAKIAPKYINPGYRSSITLTTGAASEKPIPGWSLMAGYLTGLHGLTRNLALDLKPLRVNLVSPGAVDTPLWGPQGVPEAIKKSTVLGKVGTIEEVAEAYVYFMKDTNATGSCISTNGGSLLL